jgi:hypothetical protein
MGVICVNLLKTHIEKMSDFRLSMMLLKPNELKYSLHDVDEKKGGYPDSLPLLRGRGFWVEAALRRQSAW